MRQVLR